ncbi:MAG: adenine deaminase [Syntrophobacteraceae bacterium]|nr:adenine deaminase [Syntrophobacteraceae bacterium]
MKLDSERLAGLIAVATGRRAADLCIKGCRLVNVFTGEIEEKGLAVCDGFIAGVGDYEGKQTIEAEGMFVSPGFIDGHTHIESSLLSPANYCAAVLPWGTSCVVADPHEIANVLGLAGIRYFVECARNIALDIFFNLPSCVPASPLETSGANLRGADLVSMLPDENLLGLGEMMNFPGVTGASAEVIDKLLLFQESVMDGHCPGLSGKDLNGYIAAGLASDHECTSAAEAAEKLSLGMTIMIRQGSQSKDLEKLIGIVNDYTWRRCMFVTDDLHPDDLVEKGHMNAIVNAAMSLGMAPARAIAMASWAPAGFFGLKRRGALAPGFIADFSLSPTLTPWNPSRVFKNGVEIAREGKLLVDPGSWPLPSPPEHPMHIDNIDPKYLLVPAKGTRLRVIEVLEHTLFTRRLSMSPTIENGCAVSDAERDLLKAAVYNRYVPGAKPAVGFVCGLGLKRGAIATSVAHDSHNVIAVGVSDCDILAAVSAVKQSGGGMAAVCGDRVEILPLPIAGLMSSLSAPEVSEKLKKLKACAKEWGAKLDNPYMALSFMSLSVIPELKLTDLGLVDVYKFAHVPLFEEIETKQASKSLTA